MGKLDPPGLAALASLRSIRGQRFSLDRREFAMIQSARALGVTWERIGEALGVDSPQAARQRYERLQGRIAPPGLAGPRTLGSDR